MPKVVDYERRRQEIARQGAVLFGQKGYFGTTISDIAEGCGLSRTTLYQYFSNKEEIFGYALDLFLDEVWADFQKTSKSSKLGAVAKIERMLTLLCGRFRHHKQYLAMILELKPAIKQGSPLLWGRVESFRRKVRALLGDILDEGVRFGDLVPVDSRSMALTIYLFMEALILHAAVTEEVDWEKHLYNLGFFLGHLQKDGGVAGGERNYYCGEKE